MAATVKPVPENSSVIIPRLFCRDIPAESEFCQAVFGAEELNRRPGPDGTIIHALLTIRGEMLMLEAEFPSLPSRVPVADGTSPVVIFVYVAGVDAAVERATSLGAKVLIPAKNQFWGDRIAWIMDPAGHVWTIATRIEETTADQRTDRWEKLRTS
jgi:PhnB protein